MMEKLKPVLGYFEQSTIAKKSIKFYGEAIEIPKDTIKTWKKNVCQGELKLALLCCATRPENSSHRRLKRSTYGLVVKHKRVEQLSQLIGDLRS
jgi:hypothetical protein